MPNKSLGQHWLKDRLILEAIVDSAELTPHDSVIEIGPGLGTMTSVILQYAGDVTAIEYDEQLAAKLPSQFPGKKLNVVQQDILSFNFSDIQGDYKVIGNIPYYITNKIVRALTEASHKPTVAVLLMQKEVAERIDALPGDMSVLSISAQLYYETSLGIEVPAMFFTPPPKVDSKVIVMKKRSQPLIADVDTKKFMQIVKAGFSEKRKKLRSALAGGMRMDKNDVEAWITRAGIHAEARAQELSIGQWIKLMETE